MSLEISLGVKTSKIELIERNENKIRLSIDGKEYEADVIKVENGVYSILLDDKSYNIELIQGKNNKNYSVNTQSDSFDLEIIDAQSRYQKSRQADEFDDDKKTISSPMPGKIVKIPVKVGDKVSEGQTVVIVSAMKMENEFKAPSDCVVKEICVKEGDTVDGKQTLLVLE